MKMRTVTTRLNLTTEKSGRREVNEMHLMDAAAEEEAAFCESAVSVHALTSVQDYLERRVNDLPVSPVCYRCKTAAVTFAADTCLKLAAEVEDLRGSADRLERVAANSRTNASTHGKQAEQAVLDAVRYERSAERRTLEADQLEAEMDEYRRFVDLLAGEVKLDFESC